MTAGSLLAGPTIAAKFAWRKYRTMLDVGTAQGCLPVQIAQAHPHIMGGGFDLPAMNRSSKATCESIVLIIACASTPEISCTTRCLPRMCWCSGACCTIGTLEPKRLS